MVPRVGIEPTTIPITSRLLYLVELPRHSNMLFDNLINGARHTNIIRTFVVRSLRTISPEEERPPVLLLLLNLKRD